MRPHHHPTLERLRRRRLEGRLAAILAIAPPLAIANMIDVLNCDDSGAGSLRAAVGGATSGDTVNLVPLANVCSTITLTSGEISVTQDQLTLTGPGKDVLSISGTHNSRVLRHIPPGPLDPKLIINQLTIRDGYYYPPTGNGFGGCIVATGYVSLNDSNLVNCEAGTFSDSARGGAIYAGRLTMANSTISGSTAFCYSGGSATGGGAFVSFDLRATSSTIANNTVSCRPGGTARVAGLFVSDYALIKSSTISGNSSEGDVGGLYAVGGLSSYLQIENSTISGNHAAGLYGGLLLHLGTRIFNSTIAFNTAGSGSTSPGTYRAPGIHDSAPLFLSSSLISNNSYGTPAVENDLSTVSPFDLAGASNSLVRVSTTPLPSGNITGSCPLLGPLRDNGGPTLTHALLSRSPAIDAAANPLNVANDQRGPPYLRQSGTAVDIGAYEVQQDEIVFNAGFDGCP